MHNSLVAVSAKIILSNNQFWIIILYLQQITEFLGYRTIISCGNWPFCIQNIPPLPHDCIVWKLAILGYKRYAFRIVKFVISAHFYSFISIFCYCKYPTFIILTHEKFVRKQRVPAKRKLIFIK